MSGKYAVRTFSTAKAWHDDPECRELTKSDKPPRVVDDYLIEWHGLNECPYCVAENVSNQYTPPTITEPEYDLPTMDAEALDTARREARRIADSFDHDPFAGAAERGGFVRGESDD